MYFCDPKNSKIDIVQASGRALRLDHSRNKKIGYIVVPIFHTKFDQIIERTAVSWELMYLKFKEYLKTNQTYPTKHIKKGCLTHYQKRMVTIAKSFIN